MSIIESYLWTVYHKRKVALGLLVVEHVEGHDVNFPAGGAAGSGYYHAGSGAGAGGGEAGGGADGYQGIYDNSERGYWMRADEAKEYSLIDEVLEKKKA